MAAILQTTFLKYVILNESFFIPIEISLIFVPKGPIDSNPALVLVINAWTNAKPFSEPIMA